MTDQSHGRRGEPTPIRAITHLKPYLRSFAGNAPAGGWTNTVTVTTVAVHDRTEGPEEEAAWAADYGCRQLVRVDVNDDPARTTQHSVDLSRPDAARLAAAVLRALEDTFHDTRVGELRADEAAELLTVLDEVDYALAEMRSRAVYDLCKRIGVDPDA